MTTDNVLRLEQNKRTHPYRLCVPLEWEIHHNVSAGHDMERVFFMHSDTLVCMFKTFKDLQRFVLSSSLNKGE